MLKETKGTMRKKLLKHALAFAAVMLIIAPAFALVLPAQAAGDLDLGIEYAEDIGLQEGDPRDIAASIIQVIMSFLGLVAVVIILLGGFKWMTAGGNEEKVDEARKLIVAGIVGLIIILGAWAIANWVITTMQTNVLE